ncbi:MAG TPA: hypothetical protein VFE46_09315 [Pirellulales bacterium]|jgi:hypothetical protein|nr:hypothetical protein [Pirellulales bacterium]
MQKQSRRFELLLPTKFNSGQPVPGELFADTLLELEEQFGENRQFFVNFKERLKERFQQLDIWITTYLVEVI